MSVNSHFASVSGPFLLYYNGKSAAHITPKTEQNGPHFFKTFGRLPDGRKTCWHVNDTALIHYPYSLIEEVKEKGKRSCEFYEDAQKGMTSRVSQCFIYSIDKEAFMLGARNDTKGIEEFYRSKIMVGDNQARKLLESRRMMRRHEVATVMGILKAEAENLVVF
eukprot:scaffold966_cov415-Prasinococcus_capsulatus_cf.AAC.16